MAQVHNILEFLVVFNSISLGTTIWDWEPSSSTSRGISMGSRLSRRVQRSIPRTTPSHSILWFFVVVYNLKTSWERQHYVKPDAMNTKFLICSVATWQRQMQRSSSRVNWNQELTIQSSHCKLPPMRKERSHQLKMGLDFVRSVARYQ